MDGEVSAIGPHQIEAVLKYLPLFESEGFSPGLWRSIEGEGPYFVPSPEVQAFVRALYDNGFVLQSDWTRWKDEAQQWQSHPEIVERADLASVCRLLTVHVRADRFTEGHLSRLFDSGLIVGLMRRLRQIHELMAKQL